LIGAFIFEISGLIFEWRKGGQIALALAIVETEILYFFSKNQIKIQVAEN
jgi:hypothetical protein